MIIRVEFDIAVDVEVPDGLSDSDKEEFARQKARQMRICDTDILSVYIY